jgi:hypothetical protein
MRWCSLLLSLVLIASPLHAVDLTGIVVDQSGEPISGATVKVVGVGIDTTTQTGEFRIPIPNTRIGQRVNIQIAKVGLRLRINPLRSSFRRTQLVPKTSGPGDFREGYYLSQVARVITKRFHSIALFYSNCL